jgi:hypothetical protein
MNILIFSGLLLFIIIITSYFYQKDLKLLKLFGISIGILTLLLNSLFNSGFGASTPVDIEIKNLTKKSLKIYAIIFWEDFQNEKGTYVYYNTELESNNSSKFTIDNDNRKFWLVAKNNNEIMYLNVVSKNEDNFNFGITNQDVDIQKAQLANKLTLKADKREKEERYSIFVNFILIFFLIGQLIKIKSINHQLSTIN